MEKTNGRIVKGLGGLYEIMTDSGRIECRAKGVFRHEKTAPTVGDFVTVGYDELSNPVIAEIHERKNILIRPPLANMDTLFCVIPTKIWYRTMVHNRKISIGDVKEECMIILLKF